MKTPYAASTSPRAPRARLGGALLRTHQTARFTKIVDACLSPEPSARSSVGELADELDAAIGY